MGVALTDKSQDPETMYLASAVIATEVTFSNNEVSVMMNRIGR